MFAPSEDAVQEVRDWLVASGIDMTSIVHSDNKGWFALDIPTWQAEGLFQTEYHEHVHSASGNVKIGCDEYASPHNRIPDARANFCFLDTTFLIIFDHTSIISRLV
jgi:tripeptidyl-peptidase-1